MFPFIATKKDLTSAFPCCFHLLVNKKFLDSSIVNKSFCVTREQKRRKQTVCSSPLLTRAYSQECGSEKTLIECLFILKKVYTCCCLPFGLRFPFAAASFRSKSRESSGASFNPSFHFRIPKSRIFLRTREPLKGWGISFVVFLYNFWNFQFGCLIHQPNLVLRCCDHL